MSKLERLTCETADLGRENVKKLLALFPECACEFDQVDFDKLKQVLSSKVLEGDVERYQFTWPGKRKAMAAANAKTTKTLRPCREESVNFDTTENLYIEGDNLEALKLLQAGYAGKVKMIYIDPPYNTGKDFVYRDRFSLTDKEVADAAGAFDAEGNRYEKNDSAEARYHTNWCNMMYPRLKLARELLSDDGVIFISIDDNEVTNLSKICDEIFGQDNAIAVFPRLATKSGKTPLTFMVSHDYVLCYVKHRHDIFVGEVFKDDSYKYSDEFESERGCYNLKQPLDCNSISYSPSLDYPIEHNGIKYYPGSDYEKYLERKAGKYSSKDYAWRWSKDLFQFGLENGWIVFQNGRIYTKGYLNAAIEKKPNGGYEIVKREKTRKMSTIDFVSNEYSNDIAKKQLALHQISTKFDFPKPIDLIKKLLKTHYDKTGICIDFFSGSSTTAEAVLQQNFSDGGKRKFIMVQLPEEIEDDNYNTICEIAKERIRRAGKKIQDENSLITKDLDVGFRVLKIDSSSINDVAKPVEVQTQEFDLEFGRIKADRTSEDLLFQVLLQTQLPLSESITRETICGNEVFMVGGVMMACLDEKAKLTEEFFTVLAQRKPDFVFFRDDTFPNDSARTNLEQIFKQFSPDSKIEVL